MVEPKAVPAADKTIKIIEFLASTPGAAYGVTEISRALDMNKGTVFPILQTLILNQWVEKDITNSKYALTNRLVTLAGHLVKEDRLVSDFNLVGADLERKCDELVNLHYLQGSFSDLVVANIRSSGHILRMDMPVGTILPVTCSSAGKCMICEYSDEHLALIFRNCPARYTPSTISTLEEFLDEVHTVRRQGYAFNRGELEPGIHSVGAPIRNAQGTIIAAINIVVPEGRFSPERQKEILVLVLDGARRLSALRG